MSDREKVINDLQMQIEELEERLAIVLEGQPEIVRCKDCKHRFNSCCYNKKSNRINFGVYVADDWFCADGERR